MQLIGKPKTLSFKRLTSRYSLFIGLFFLTAFSVPWAKAAEVADSVSPYVAMHKGDLIVWRAWNASLLQQAKKEQKLIYISIGYFSCYWCHVLQRESFKNKKVAEYVNQHFVSSVIDREIHTALDNRMAAFAEKTLGRSGWPLNIILTPDGYPLMAAIYYPPDQFLEWFKNAQALWLTDKEYVSGIAKDASFELAALVKPTRKPVTEALTKQSLKRFVKEIKQSQDEFNGGFGEQSKFPLPAILNAVYQAHVLTKDDALKQFLFTTLDRIQRKGLRDHLEEGFFRYTTDPDWHEPHFEKMLYDNAQLAELYLKLGKAFKYSEWIHIGESVLSFVSQKMQLKPGAYLGSFSAVDEAGVEGGYYLWPESQWRDLLNRDEQKIVSIVWDWKQPSHFEEGYYPVYVDDVKVSESRMRRITEKLRLVRDKRLLPADEKILVAWNALLLDAYLTAYAATKNSRYLDDASAMVDYLASNLSAKKLVKGFIGDQSLGNGELEDHAFLAHALLRFNTYKNDPKIRDFAEILLAEAWQRFYDDSGWRISDSVNIPVIQNESLLADGPLPSASARLIKASLLSKNPVYVAKAKEAMQLGHGFLNSQAFWYASHVMLIQDSYAKE